MKNTTRIVIFSRGASSGLAERLGKGTFAQCGVAHPSLPRPHAVVRGWYGSFLEGLDEPGVTFVRSTGCTAASSCRSISAKSHEISELMERQNKSILTSAAFDYRIAIFPCTTPGTLPF